MNNVDFTAAKLPRQCIKCSAMFTSKGCHFCAQVNYQKTRAALNEKGAISASVIAEFLFASQYSPSGLCYRHAATSTLGVVIRQAGEIAGSKNKSGYWRVHVDGWQVSAHQAMFALAHGRMPISMLDHINGHPGDNRPENLREATFITNARNRKLQDRNRSGKNGVDRLTFNGYEYWRARWYSAEGKLANKQFSIQKLGDAGAFQEACTYRDAMTAAVGGYTKRHGTNQ